LKADDVDTDIMAEQHSYRVDRLLLGPSIMKQNL